MSTPVNAQSEMAFFSLLVRAGSLSAAARELNVTTAGVSKRLSQMEARLGTRLLHRTTRRIGLTAEGEIYLEHSRILADIEDMEQMITSAATAPKGLLRDECHPRLRPSYIAPPISAFYTRYPDVDVQLQLTVNPPTLIEDACDVWIRFGEPHDTRVIARRLASNRRLICASGLSGAPRHAARAERPDPPQLHRHPPGRGRLRHLAPERGPAHRDRQGARRAEYQRWGDHHQLGTRRARPDHAGRMGYREIPAERSTCARCCRTGKRRRPTSMRCIRTSCRRRRGCSPRRLRGRGVFGGHADGAGS